MWGELANTPYVSRVAQSYTKLRDPKARVILNMLAQSITSRKSSSEKVKRNDLFYLGAIMRWMVGECPRTFGTMDGDVSRRNS